MPDPMLWLLLALTSAALFALGNIADKFAVSKRLGPESYYAIIGGSYLLLVFASATFFSLGFSPAAAVAMAAGMMMGSVTLLYLFALSREEVSRVVAFYFTEGLFVALFAALFLGEILTPLKYAGMGLIVAGAVLISLKRLEVSFRAGLLPLLVVAAVYAGASVLLKYATGGAGYLQVLVWMWAGYGLSFLIIAGPRLLPIAREIMRAGRKTVLVSAFANLVIYPLANLVYIYALSLQKASIVAPVTATQALFVVIFAALVSRFVPRLFKEEITAGTLAVKAACALLIIIGVYLVS